ncbi:MAG: InlB B-repeat-containing protein, partial [Oscillibacter sp.]|nr:InlB B-repeat-containing protein [Oscillibacter sp.]
TAKTGGAQVTPETVCDSDATLFAHWTAVEYTVTLSLKGGDLPHDAENWTVSDSIGSATFRSDGGPFVLLEAVRDGYVFTGWTTENAPAKLKVSIPKGNTENLTYKANWTEGSRSAYASFTKDDGSGSGFLGIKDLTQDANRTSAQTGGTDSGVKSYIAAALQELSFDDDTPLAGNQRKDVSVSMTARVLSEDAAQEDETVTQEREEIADAAGELYGGDSTVKLDYLAIDIEKTVSVTTTEGDGTETVNPGAPEKVTESHRVIEIPLRYDLTGRYNPVVIRYHGGAASAFRRLAERPEEFGGLDGAYYVSGAGNDAVIYIYSSRFSSYAVTTSGRESYAVFFDTDGGTEINAQIVYRDKGGHAERPQDPVKDGYKFNGWRVEKNGSRRDFDFDAEIINIDTILYADWEREEKSEPEPVPEPVATPVYSGGSSGPSAPVLQEYVTANGYRGVYNGASHSIQVSAPKGTTVLYSREENGAYTSENPSFRDAGEYVVWYQVSGMGYPTVRDFETVEIQRREVTVSGIAAESKPYDGNAAATLNYNRVKFDGIVKGDELTITATGTFENEEIGDGKTVVITNLILGGGNAGNYRLADSGQQTEAKANITENELNVTAAGYSGTYDGDAHSVSVDAPDGVSVTYSESENGIYSAENPAYVNAGYYLVYYRVERDDGSTLTGSAAVNIARRPVTVSGIRAKDKPYDGSVSAELDYDNVSLDGIVTGDRLEIAAEGAFESAEVGDDKTVLISNLTLRGDNAGNYRLADSGQQTETKANITPNVLEVNAESYVGVYDREPHGIRVEAPEGATVTYSERESGPYSETIPAYRDAGEYAVYYRVEQYGYESVSGSATVTVYKRPVRVSGISAADKPYDGNINASLSFNNATLEGRISGDDIGVTAGGAFEDAQSGTDKTVFITGLSLRGADAGNYWIVLNESQSATRADITPNPLQVSVSGYSGVYDGKSHGVSVDAPDGVSVLYVESERGTYSATAPSYRNAGEYAVYYRAVKAGAPEVTGSVIISIEKREVAVSGITAADKPYDGNTSATLNYDNVTISGIITGDRLTVTATGTFASPDAGKGKAVRITGLTLGGADAGNYRLASRGQQTETQADITRKSYAVTGSIRHEDAEGNVTLELLDGNAVRDSASAMMMKGVGTYSFRHVPSGSYTLVVARDDNGQKVTLSMPLRVGA